MQKQKRKKKQKKKEELQSNNIIPKQHDRINNLNYYSEEVVKEIIDKIISFSITNTFRKSVNSKISPFCFEGIIHILNIAVSLIHINHDIDNIYNIENMIDDKKRLNTDEKRYKINNHYKCNKVRYKLVEDNLLEYANINREYEEEMNLKDKHIIDFLNKTIDEDFLVRTKRTQKANFWGTIMQPKSFGPQRLASRSNHLNPGILMSKKQNNEYNKENKNTPKRKKYPKIKSSLISSFSSLKLSNSKIETNSINSLEIKPKKFDILEMGQMKNIEENIFNKEEEPEEIKELRKLSLEKIKYLQEEEKIKAAKKKIIQDSLKMDYNIDNINLTNLEKSKNIKVQRKYIEEQIKKGNFTVDFNNNIILIRQVRPDNLIQDLPEAISKSKDKELIFDESIQNINNKAKKKVIVESKNSYNYNSVNYYNFNYGWKVEPSGSNFEIINPEIGVTVKEDNMAKSGGNHFYDKYKKYSLKDYNKILNEILSQQEIINNEEGEIKKDNLLNQNKKDNNSIDISKIKKGLNPFNQKIKNIKMNLIKINIMQKKLNKSQSEISTKDRVTLFNKILVHEEKKKEKNKIIENPFTHRINTKNLFLEKMKKIIIEKNNNKSYQIIDNFNKSIIKNMNKANNIIKKNMSNLPIIPFRKNKSVIFSKKDRYHRTRIKKSFNN